MTGIQFIYLLFPLFLQFSPCLFSWRAGRLGTMSNHPCRLMLDFALCNQYYSLKSVLLFEINITGTL